jgi:hypothetical protein
VIFEEIDTRIGWQAIDFLLQRSHCFLIISEMSG